MPVSGILGKGSVLPGAASSCLFSSQPLRELGVRAILYSKRRPAVVSLWPSQPLRGVCVPILFSWSLSSSSHPLRAWWRRGDTMVRTTVCSWRWRRTGWTLTVPERVWLDWLFGQTWLGLGLVGLQSPHFCRHALRLPLPWRRLRRLARACGVLLLCATMLHRPIRHRTIMCYQLNVLRWTGGRLFHAAKRRLIPVTVVSKQRRL